MLPTKAYAAANAKSPLAPLMIQRRDLGPHDILIDIKFCGVCHSDIHQSRNGWGGSIYPMVPGHEIVGIVSRIGDQAMKHKVGDAVGVGCFVDSCRDCTYCREGLEQYCVQSPTQTYNCLERDQRTPTLGGYSDKIVVDEDYVLRMPSSLPLDAAAPLLCAGITLYSPLKHWKAGPGKKVAVVGLGGLGHMGLKFAHAFGAEVTVISQSLRKQDEAKSMGAAHFYASSDPAIFGKLSMAFDLIINTVSADVDWNQYLSLLKVDGAMVVVGIPEAPTPISAPFLIAKRRSLSGSQMGGIKETQEMLDFCGRHNIVSDIEITSIQKINEAYERILKSDVRYRFVIDMATL
jgi:alcohol dehydrogenase (NADP+)